jgi:hypothetical protein
MKYTSQRIDSRSRFIRFFGLFLFCVVFCDSIGLGQEEVRREISAGVGISIPMGPESFTYQWNTGFNLGGMVTSSISPVVSLGIAVDYSRYGFDINKLLVAPPERPQVVVSGGAANIISITPVFQARFSRNREKLAAFALVGLGYHHESTGDLTLYDIPSGQFEIFYGTSHSAVSLSAGLGIDIPVNESTGIILQSQFFNAFTENQATQYAQFRAAMRFTL